MAEETKIAWADATFNPWIGCAKVSDACKHCYAEVDTFARRERARGVELWGVSAARHVTSDAYWRQPLRWNAEAEKTGVRRRVFCASLSDVFEDRDDLRAPRARLFDLTRSTPNLDWLLLTKRPENADVLWRNAAASFALTDRFEVRTRPAWGPNVWLGTTVEDQESVARIAHLLAVPAKVRFVSCEPLLEDVALRFRPVQTACDSCSAGVADAWNKHVRGLCACACHPPSSAKVDWVIIGGESGPKARPFQLDWARSLIRQCRQAGAAPFVKQLGACASDPENGLAGAKLVVNPDAADLVSQRLVDPKGGDMSEWPMGLRVRELPTTT